MISNGKWKLIRDFNNPGRDELYDLMNDPAESNNLIEFESEMVQAVRSQLERELLSRMQAVGDEVHR
tara:strand:- start:1469 stop:1669 length:201 start_codon:yes stop_codon:yes gene_type:complete